MPGRGGLERIVGLVDHAEFERRGLAEDLLHLGGILQTGQLDGDAVDSLARHLGLGHRELRAIQAVAQDDDVLLDGVVLALLDFLRRQHELERRRAVDRRLGQMQVAVVGENGGLALGLRVGVAEQHAHAACRVVHLHVLIGDVRGAQRSAEVLLAVIEQLLDRARDVHLVHEVHAAAQVETELQRIQAEAAHPLRNARGLGKRDR